MEQTRTLLLKSGALLLFLGFLTGAFVAAAMTGKVPANPDMALASHLNAILGAFVLFGLALCLPHLKYGDIGRTRLAWAMIVPNFANWLITAAKAFWGVHGVDATGEPTNDIIFGLLTLFVVIPSLAGGLFWTLGFSKTGAR